jgi:hypothetical protein
MRAAVVRISDNVVENIIVADASKDAPPREGAILVNVGDAVQIGWVMQGDTFVDPDPATPLEPVPVVPVSITRRQCALELHALQYITLQEALDMVKTATVPFPIALMFDTQVAQGNWTDEQHLLAEIDFAATNYYRSNSLLDLMGFTPEQLDAFFISAAQR